MSIRFAAADSPKNPLRCISFVERDFCATNDNCSGALSEDYLEAALRHFAKHGLAAAGEARREAEAAALRNDDDGFALWHGICGALDRRMGRDLDSKRARQG